MHHHVGMLACNQRLKLAESQNYTSMLGSAIQAPPASGDSSMLDHTGEGWNKDAFTMGEEIIT